MFRYDVKLITKMAFDIFDVDHLGSLEICECDALLRMVYDVDELLDIEGARTRHVTTTAGDAPWHIVASVRKCRATTCQHRTHFTLPNAQCPFPHLEPLFFFPFF